MDSLLTQHTLLTPAETASILRVSRRTVSRYGAEGRLDVVRMSPRNFKYRAESVAALIAGQPTPDTSSGTGSARP